MTAYHPKSLLIKCICCLLDLTQLHSAVAGPARGLLVHGEVYYCSMVVIGMKKDGLFTIPWAQLSPNRSAAAPTVASISLELQVSGEDVLPMTAHTHTHTHTQWDPRSVSINQYNPILVSHYGIMM